MKIYLDSNIVTALVKNDMPAESAALTKIVGLFQARTVNLVTSTVTGDEIKRYKGPQQPEMEQLYGDLKKVPFVDEQELLGFHSQWDDTGGFTYPLIEDDPIWSQLHRTGLDRTDAHHLMLAIRDGCDVFLTCDERTILSHRADIESSYPIRLLKPSSLISVLTAT